MSMPSKITYLKNEGHRYIFLMDTRWTSMNDWWHRQSLEPYPFEEYLEACEVNWYYGGNRYLEGDERNHGIVIIGEDNAALFRMYLTKKLH